MQVLWLTLLLAASAFAAAQSPPPTLWQMQESGTTAGLRGIECGFTWAASLPIPLSRSGVILPGQRSGGYTPP